MSETEQPIILLAEDNPDHAELILTSLKMNHQQAQVIQLSDGEETLAYLQRRGAYADAENSPRPTLILLDLRMPKVDGFEVLQWIKDSEDLKCIPVVILTTSEAEQDMVRAYNLHANSYLVKPDDYDGLNELLHQLKVYWIGKNRTPQASS
jgi:CheY-like chemotaxis protein